MSPGPKKRERLGKRDQVLLAAFACCEGDASREFSAEDLLLQAWKEDSSSWGLRGYENDHPNSEKIYTEIDRGTGKGGFVGEGLFERVRQRVYRLTPLGFSRLAGLQGDYESAGGLQARRVVEHAIASILGHPVLLGWLKDSSTPKRFREASHFWNIAPGTPQKVARDRIRQVDATLRGALDLIEDRQTEAIVGERGQRLYDRHDIERCMEFHDEMKRRFTKELLTLAGLDVFSD